MKQTKYIVVMTKAGTTKIVNVVTPGARVLVLGRDNTSNYGDYALSATYHYTEHWLLLF